jgi:hypothetical protein
VPVMTGVEVEVELGLGVEVGPRVSRSRSKFNLRVMSPVLGQQEEGCRIIRR